MSLQLPTDSRAALFEVEHLVDMVVNRRYTTLADAKYKASQAFTNSALKSIMMIVLRSTDDLQLVEFRKKSFKILWNFGSI